MANKTFNVEHYKVSLNHELTASWSGTTVKACGKVVCYGDDHRLIVYFLKDDSPLPKPVYLENENVGVIYFHFTEMRTFTDLLRHEKPIYAYLNNSKPEWIGIGTFREPIGEQES